MFNIHPDASVCLRPPKASVPKELKETALESLRRYNVYTQLIEAYQFGNCHPKMATIIIGVGICLHLPSVLFYSCYYLIFLTNIYCTVLPSLPTLFNFKSMDMKNFQPPWHVFLFCALNLVTCYLGIVCVVLCSYVLLPMKGRYLATVQKQHKRRRWYCIVLSLIIAGSVSYQIVLSLMRSSHFLQERLESNHLTLLSPEQLGSAMQAQGLNSFWTLHAYQHLPCCQLHEPDTAVLREQLPVECCQTFGRAAQLTAKCRNSTSRDSLLPHCVSVVLNIASDIEVTMDAQMQLFLLISCIVNFVIKFALHPHMLMLCSQCQPTYGWCEMRRRDN